MNNTKSVKTCTRCKESRPISEFGRNRRNTDGYQRHCRGCVAEYNRNYYKKTPERNQQRSATTRRRRGENAEFVLAYLQTHPCVDCGESDPVVLEFDHLKDKVAAVSKLVYAGVAISTLKAEIAKCEVRCANCHRRVTAQRGSWYRLVTGVAADVG